MGLKQQSGLYIQKAHDFCIYVIFCICTKKARFLYIYNIRGSPKRIPCLLTLNKIMSENYNQEIRGRILVFLSGTPFAHISEVARGVKTTRITARKHLERLENEGVVREYKKGMLRVFALKQKGGVL